MGVCRSRPKKTVRRIARKHPGHHSIGGGRATVADAHGKNDGSPPASELDESPPETETMLRAISNSVVDAMVMVDAQGCVLYWNPAAARMFGYSSTEVLGRSLHLVLAPHLPDAGLAETFARFAETGEAPQIGKVFEVEARRKDGSLFSIELSVSAFRMRGQWCAAAIVRDVTARKQAERQLHEYARALTERTAELTRTNRRLGREVEKRKEAHEALRREQQHLRRLVELHDYERRLISFEIHDGLAQDLAGAIMYLASAHSALAQGADGALDLLERGLELLREGHEEARRLISGLRPPILDDCGLSAAIEELIAQRSQPEGPEIEFANHLGQTRLSPLLEQTIFRIVQEGLTNACRYSDSRRVRIEIFPRDDGGARLVVRDWGKGFDPRAVRRGAFGLKGIKERIRLLGGQAGIESVPGQGTQIVAELPQG